MRSVIISAFFMLLQQVYKHSKWLFAVIIFFIAGQVFINYKRGVVFSPFYHYGMYSEVMNIKNSYEVLEVEQNGKVLRGQDFSPHQWDKIMLPLQYFAALGKSNSLYQSDIKRLLAKIHLAAADKNFMISCNYQQFENWYRKYLQQITKQPVTSLNIRYHIYHFTAGKLNPADSVTMLSQLCP